MMAVYGTSVGVLALAEAWAGQVLPAENFGQYSLARTTIPLVGLIGTLAVEQVIPREALVEAPERHNWAVVARPPMRRLLGLAPLSGLICWWLLDFGALASVAIAVAPVLVGATNLVAGVYRAARSYTRAAWYQQGYRLFTGLILLAIVWVNAQDGLRGALDVSALIPLVPMVGAGAMGVVGARTIQRLYGADGPPAFDVKAKQAIGIGFALSTLSLGGIDWADQAALSRLASREVLGIYSAGKTILIYPLVAAASIVGFTAIPELMRRRGSFRPVHYYVALGSAFGVAGFVGVGMMSVAGLVGLDRMEELSSTTKWYLVVAGATRFASLVPSVALGALGSSRRVFSYALIGIGVVLVEFLGVSTAFSLWGLEGAAGALAIAGLTRLAAGVALGGAVFRAT